MRLRRAKKEGMVASTVIERAASADAAPKEMARSWSTCPARRRVSAFNNAGRPQIASDKAQSQRKGKVAVHLPEGNGGRNPM